MANKKSKRYSNRNNKSSRNRGHSGRGRRKISAYDPTQFVNNSSGSSQDAHVVSNTFSDFNLHSQLLGNITAKGYTEPTPIQDMSIPLLLEGKDIVGVAHTGTGKTAAFLIPLIHKMLTQKKQKALVVTPTRELAVQVEKEFRSLTKDTYLRSAVCIGGVRQGKQVKQLKQNPDLVVGTPGRLQDLGKQRKLNFSEFNILVLDEVDRMLDMGFVKDVQRMVKFLPSDRQSLFFSATLPDKVEQVVNRFAKNPITISVKTESVSVNVDQEIIELNGRSKPEVLEELLRKDEFEKVLVFGRTKRGVDKLMKTLSKRNISTERIHGNRSQNQRRKALQKFRNDAISVLLATDVASRGLDINDITHVINYDLPGTHEDYVHRIGRTGRANKTGTAITFVE